MKPVTESTFLICDSGLFLPMAFRIAEEAKRVIYWSPDQRSMPSVKQAVIGDGFDEIERVRDFWPLLNEIDCACFPDIGQAALQEHLVNLGVPVWGSRSGDVYELNREKLMDTLNELGLDVPEFEVIEGWTALREHLRNKEDKYIKISRYRGDMETTHWRTWSLDEGWLMCLGVTFGSIKEDIRFLVFDSIETDLEIGADTYCVKGKFPNLMLSGTEIKDRGYFGSVMTRTEMPDPIQQILTAFGPLLDDYQNQLSMEVRVKDDKAYFLDATQRASMPGSASQQILWENFPEIVLMGANGELIQPEEAAKFSIEAMIKSKCRSDLWDEVELPTQLKRWVRFSNCAFVDGRYCFPPTDGSDSRDLGWLVAIGDTPDEVLENAKDLASLLPPGLHAEIEPMVDAIKEIEAAKEIGLELSTAPMPEIEDVVS